MKPFYARLSYSFGNEDFRTESKALQLTENDSILVVTASGDRTLNLLTTKVKDVYSIDANPIQNALLDLKMAALRKFDYTKYIAFLGLIDCPHRTQLYQELQKELSPSTLLHLAPYAKQIKKGIIYQGAVEKLITTASIVIRAIRRTKVTKLFSFTNVEEQADFVEKHWDTPGLRALFKLAINPYVSRLFFKDPGLYEHIDSDINSVNHIYNRCHTALTNFLVKENLILSLTFQGKVYEEGYPPYLGKEKNQIIKSQIDKIKIESIDLISCLKKAADNSFDAFSLSDVSSYLSQEQFSIMVKEMVRTAKPGARFCLRQFLSNHTIPKEVLPFLERKPALEKELEAEDRCFVYHFLVGTIKKTQV